MANALNIETRSPLFLTAGVTAGFDVDGNTYVNEVTDDNSSLQGWDFTLDIRQSYGVLEPGVDYEYDGEETITILIPDYKIGDGEKWIIQFQPKVADVNPAYTSQVDYTNGYQVAPVMNALMGRIRFRQPTRSDFPFTLTVPNVWPDDDQYSSVYEAIHKAVTPYIIWQVQEDAEITEVQFNKLLQNLIKDTWIKSLCSVFNKKEFLEQKLLFERFGRQDYINLNEGKFVGMRIKPCERFDVATQIEYVSLKFDADVTFNLHLFHDAQPTAPLKSFSVTAVANEQITVNLNEIISYASHHNKSGVYFLGYFQDDLGDAHAINEIVQQFNTMNYFGCVPIELPKIDAGINVNQISFTIKTHGMNVKLSAFRDYTQSIINNAHLFDNLGKLQMAADVIEMIQTTLRTNKDQRNIQDLTKSLFNDLNLAKPTEEIPFATGLKVRIENEAHRVKREFFPKDKVKSVTHDTNNTNIYGTPAPMIEAFRY